ncbi:MAG: hypothetical protein AAF809_03890 [Bacteroidota bacterium]
MAARARAPQEHRSSLGAAEVAAQGQFLDERAVPSLLRRRRESGLHAGERCEVGERLVDALDLARRVALPGGHLDHSCVELLLEQEHELRLRAAEAALDELTADHVGGEIGVGGEPERFGDEGRLLRARHDEVAVERVAAPHVALRRDVHPPPFEHRAAHPSLRRQRTTTVLDLGRGDVDGEHHELLGHGAVDGLLNGLHAHAERFEAADHRERTGRVAAEPIPLHDEDSIDARRVGLDVCQELRPRGALEGLGAMVVLVVGGHGQPLAVAVGA